MPGGKEAVRWRDQGTIQRGVCFAAGCGLWGGRWRLSGTDYGGDSGPIVYGPVGINAPARWRIKVASRQAVAKARRTRDAISKAIVGHGGRGAPRFRQSIWDRNEF